MDFNVATLLLGLVAGGIVAGAIWRVPGFGRALLAFAAAFVVISVVQHGTDVVGFFRHVMLLLRGQEDALLGAGIAKAVVAFVARSVER